MIMMMTQTKAKRRMPIKMKTEYSFFAGISMVMGSSYKRDSTLVSLVASVTGAGTNSVSFGLVPTKPILF